MLAGRIQVTLGHERHRLDTGDCLAMLLDQLIVYANRTRHPARYVVVVSAESPFSRRAVGASVSFMWPLAHHEALAFWRDALDSARRGERIVLVAEEVKSHTIVGTVQIVFAIADNQPHRADVAKMLVHRRARRRGLGAALMQAAEQAARAANKTLLVLDTVTDSDAERLYARLGWRRLDVIPGYALWPTGGTSDTTYFYKALMTL